MRSDLHDEIGVEGGGDSFQQWDRGHDTARFQPGQGGLCHPGPGGELDLEQAEGQAALTHGLADQESPASFRIPLAVLLALSPRPGEFLPPTVDVLAAWCQACHLDDELFGRLAALARRADGPVPSWFEGWLEAEGKAHTLRVWAPVLLPGLLQTDAYARALFLAMGMDEDAAEEQVAVRLGRQEILDRPEPPQVVVVLYEAVLHHLVGSSQAMHDALVHVAELSQRPNLTIQVITVDTGANAGLGGSFSLASGDGAPEVLLMETVEDVTTETRSLVRRAANIFVRIQADALPRAASRALILEAAEQWKTR